MKKVALVVCRQLGALDAEDAPLPAALEAVGLEAETVSWDDPAVRWDRYAAAVLRSPWDYFRRYSEFLAWLERVEGATLLHNPPAVIRWNSHKQYLLELRSAGVPVVPTLLLRRGEKVRLEEVVRAEGWTDVVAKPAVSAGGFRTERHPDPSAASAQKHLEELLTDVDVLLQPYQSAVTTSRERSLIFIDGTLSHAIAKRSVFEVTEAGGTPATILGAVRAQIEPITPSEDELGLAKKVLAATPGAPLLYARVDLIRGAQGPLLMELEAFEPSLYLASFPQGASTLAAAIAARVR